MCLLVLWFTNRWHECIEDSDYGNLLQEAASRENEQGIKTLQLMCVASFLLPGPGRFPRASILTQGPAQVR
jgi:hypothetical protein